MTLLVTWRTNLMKHKIQHNIIPRTFIGIAIQMTHTMYGMQPNDSISAQILNAIPYKEMLLTTGYTLLDTVKKIGFAVLTKAEFKPAFFFILGIILICYGSLLFGKTILTSGLKIMVSLLLIGAGIASFIASNNAAQ